MGVSEYRGSQVIRPARGRCLVRRVATEERLPGGLVILTEKTRETMAQLQVQIVAVGEPEVCEDEDCEKFHRGPCCIGGDEFGNFDGHSGPVTPYRIHPRDPRIKPNAWAIVQPRSFVDASIDGDELFVVKTDDVLGVFVQK